MWANSRFLSAQLFTVDYEKKIFSRHETNRKHTERIKEVYSFRLRRRLTLKFKFRQTFFALCIFSARKMSLVRNMYTSCIIIIISKNK